MENTSGLRCGAHMSPVCAAHGSVPAAVEILVWVMFYFNWITGWLIAFVLILQTQGSHLPLRLLWGRVITWSHPANLQVRLHRDIRLQLQHRADGAVRPAVRLSSVPLTRRCLSCQLSGHICLSFIPQTILSFQVFTIKFYCLTMEAHYKIRGNKSIKKKKSPIKS